MVTWVDKASVNQGDLTEKNDELVKNRNKWLYRRNKREKSEWYFFRIFLKQLRCPCIRPVTVPMFYEE
jgi:hypothetical protein